MLYEVLSIRYTVFEAKAGMLLIFITVNVVIGVFETWSNLAWAELVKSSVVAEDRGSVAGLELMLGLMVTMFKLFVILNLPTRWVYLVLFVMTLFSQVVAMVLVVWTKVRLARGLTGGGEETQRLVDKTDL